MVMQLAESAPTTQEKTDCVNAHNAKRALHESTPDIAYDSTLQADAQSWAENLFSISQLNFASLTGIGESLYRSSSSSKNYRSCVDFVESAYRGVQYYNFSTGTSSGGSSGLFTQLVWKASTQMAFGIKTGLSGGKYWTYLVVRYKPPGNFAGQFLSNVGNLISSVTTVSTTPGSTVSTVSTTPGSTVTTTPYVPPSLSKEDRCLQCHNSRRALHTSTPDLQYDTELDTLSQGWADYLARTGKFEHDPKNREQGTGENLYYYMGSGYSGITCENACAAWYSEIKDYDFQTHGKKSGTTNAIGHFTQMVWKQTSKVGCAIAYNGTKVYIVAKYRSPGNYLGQYAQNVMPRIASNSGALEAAEPPPKPEPQSPAGIDTAFEVDPPSFCTRPKYQYKAVYVILLKINDRLLITLRRPSSYTLKELQQGVDGCRIIRKFTNPSNYKRRCRCGYKSSWPTSASSRKRRDTEDPNDPIVPSNPELEPASTYTVFYRAEVNSDMAITSDWYQPVRTQPSGGNFCVVPKSCVCNTLPEVNITEILSNVTYYGVDQSAVNASLVSIGRWDKQTFLLFCKQAQCNSTTLMLSASNIEVDINKIKSDIGIIDIAKKNIRIALDCHTNVNGTRTALFDSYEELCSRNIVMKNVMEDLQIKKKILENEDLRCKNRSWLRQVLENMWRKS